MSAQNSLQYLKEDFAAKRVTRQHKPTLKQRRWKRSFSSALAWIRFPKPLMHWCECVEFFGCSLHCFKGFLTSSKTIDSTWKTEYENPSRANSKVKLWSFSFLALCKFSFDVYAHPWVFFPLSPLPLWFLCIETFLDTAVQTMINSNCRISEKISYHNSACYIRKPAESNLRFSFILTS